MAQVYLFGTWGWKHQPRTTGYKLDLRIGRMVKKMGKKKTTPPGTAMPAGNVTCKFIKPDGNRCGAKPKEDGFCINVHHNAEKNVRVPGEVKVTAPLATVAAAPAAAPGAESLPSSPAVVSNVAPPPFAPIVPGPVPGSTSAPNPPARQEVTFPSSAPSPVTPITGSTNGFPTPQSIAGPVGLPPGFANLTPIQPVQPVQKQKLPPQPPPGPQQQSSLPLTPTSGPPMFGGGGTPTAPASPGEFVACRVSNLSWLADAHLLTQTAQLLKQAAKDPDHQKVPAMTPDTFQNLAEEYQDLHECAQALCESLIRLSLYHMGS